MPVPKSGTSVFSLGVGVEKIRRCNAELMRWMVLWEASTGLSMWTAAPAGSVPPVRARRNLDQLLID
jgi:hypothetical protein